MSVEVLPLILPPKWPTGWPEREEHKIAKAAIKVGDKVYVGWRHADIIRHLQYNDLAHHVDQEMQGFVDNMGWFFDRRQSAKIAAGARQCSTTQIKAMTLTSEDLWDADGTPREAKPYDPMGDYKSRRFQ